MYSHSSASFGTYKAMYKFIGSIKNLAIMMSLIGIQYKD